MRYLKFGLKAMLVVNGRVEDQGPQRKLDCTTGEGRRAVLAVRTAGWLLELGAGQGWSRFLFVGIFMGGCYYTLLFLKNFFFLFFFFHLGDGVGHTGGFICVE